MTVQDSSYVGGTESRDILSDLEEVEQFLLGYEGSFEFLVAMRDKVLEHKPLTDNMVRGVRRCMEREQRSTRPSWTEAVAERAEIDGARVEEPGMYIDGDDIFKVQRSKESGNLYAKKLVKIGGERMIDADESVVNFEFEYDRGAIFRLRADQRMTLEQARAFGIRYGVCCVCGARLKDATSVANGIGPVCGGRI